MKRNIDKNPSMCDTCIYDESKSCRNYWPCSAGCPNHINDQCACLAVEEGTACPHYKAAAPDGIHTASNVVLPCNAGDLVHFKGVDTPCKVSAIHLYAEGEGQISLTCGKATSTITFAEFYECCTVLTDTEAPKK